MFKKPDPGSRMALFVRAYFVPRKNWNLRLTISKMWSRYSVYSYVHTINGTYVRTTNCMSTLQNEFAPAVVPSSLSAYFLFAVAIGNNCHNCNLSVQQHDHVSEAATGFVKY